ncbi:MAG: hypothetical protein HY208_06525 [Nitrospirae bacterium]|nr:hypothetical protein [Nitrospirota bacterium]
MTAMSERNAVIAVYRNHEQANGAVRTLLRQSPGSRLSLVTRDRLAGDRIMIDDHGDGTVSAWGKLGVFGSHLWGPGLWGTVMGWASLWVPGLGPLLIGGPLVSQLLGAHDGAAVFGPLTPVGVSLYRIGVSKNGIRRYEEAIRKNRYLLVVQGRPDEVVLAGRRLSATDAEIIALHAPMTPVWHRSKPERAGEELSVTAGRTDQPFPLGESSGA